MTDDPKCEAGCMVFDGGERKHHPDCHYYPESLTKLNHDTITALRAQLAEARAERDVWEIDAKRNHQAAEIEFARADRAEAERAAQIEADAGICSGMAREILEHHSPASAVNALRAADKCIRAQLHSRTALARLLADAEAKALRKAADLAAHYTDKITAEDIANAILAMIPKEGA